jgi:hypothetical protein
LRRAPTPPDHRRRRTGSESRGVPGSHGRLRAYGNDEIHVSLNQLGGECGKAVAPAVRVQTFEGQVLAFDPAQLSESFNERLPICIGVRSAKPPDSIHLRCRRDLRREPAREQGEEETEYVSSAYAHLISSRANARRTAPSFCLSACRIRSSAPDPRSVDEWKSNHSMPSGVVSRPRGGRLLSRMFARRC